MIHGRPDYNRIQDPAAEPEIYRLIGAIAAALDQHGVDTQVLDVIGESAVTVEDPRAFAARAELPPTSSPIATDEPVFLLRAKDMCAPAAVDAWARIAAACNARRGIIDAAHEVSRQMGGWEIRNGCKAPDMEGVAP